jgi:hypothetical protein
VQRLFPVVTGLDSGARAAVGGAIEWAIGLDLADTVPYADVFDTVTREEAARILQTAGLQPVSGRSADGGLGMWRRPETWAPPEPATGLLRDAWMLCQYAGIMRQLKAPDPEQLRQFTAVLGLATIRNYQTIRRPAPRDAPVTATSPLASTRPLLPAAPTTPPVRSSPPCRRRTSRRRSRPRRPRTSRG